MINNLEENSSNNNTNTVSRNIIDTSVKVGTSVPKTTAAGSLRNFNNLKQ